MKRLISASTPATMRSSSARSDVDVTWMEMSDGAACCTSRISSSGWAASAVARSAISPNTMKRGLSIRRSMIMSISSGIWMSKVICSPRCRVTAGSWTLTFAVTLAILPGPWAIGPIGEFVAGDRADRAPTRSSVTAISKNLRPNSSYVMDS